jgi:hypothetical protein
MPTFSLTTLNLSSSNADLFSKSKYFKVKFPDSKIASGEKNV